MSDTFNPFLFVPHKDAIAHSCDAPMVEANSKLRTNWLAIQRWANQAIASAGMAQSTAQTILVDGALHTLTNFSKQWDSGGIGSTATSTLTVPQSGIYHVDIDVNWLSIASASSEATQPLVQLTGSSSTISSPPFVFDQRSVVPIFGVGAAGTSLSWTFKATGKGTITAQASVVDNLLFSTTLATLQTVSFTISRIGNIPSPTQ